MGVEALNAVRQRGGDEVFEQEGSDALRVVGVGHRERHLGTRSLGVVVVRAHPDELARHLDPQREPVAVVDVEHLRQFDVGRRARREEAHSHALRGQPVEQRPHRGQIVGSERPHLDDPTVGEDDIGLPVLPNVGREHNPSFAPLTIRRPNDQVTGSFGPCTVGDDQRRWR